ncbi:MAG: redoxin domain-containing protein [Phycisphaerales bacterium]
MRRGMQWIGSAAAMGLVTGGVAFAEGDLSVGDAAPAIEISHWVKGEEVKSFENGKVYVVEFWATWCGPCRASMPHISELQTEFRDYGVTFIGVSDEKLATVVDFLAQKDDENVLWYDKIDYTLATDPDRSVFDSYMKAAGQNGIPTAFIVGKTGEVEWIGHPVRIDDPLAKVVRDEWNRDEFRREFEAQRKLNEAMKSGNYQEALGYIDELMKVDEERYGYLLSTKFQVMLGDMNEPAKAYKIGEQAVERSWDNANALNSIAWFVVDNPKVQERNLDFAMKVAQRAAELSDHKNGAILDTLARVYYEKGDLDAAIKWQRKAVESENEGPMRTQLKEVLEQYEREKN